MNLSVNELMKRQDLLHRQTLVRFVSITVFVVLSIYGVGRWNRKEVPKEGIGKDDWVYLQKPRETATKKGTAAEASVKLDPALEFYAGRPGVFVSGPQDDGTSLVKFDLQSKERVAFSDEEERKKNKVELPVPHALLKLCPAGQEDVDSTFEGVVRAWMGTEGADLEQQAVHEAKLGDKVTVEVRNFDVWLFEQMEYGRFREDLNDLQPPELRPYVEKAVAARRAVQFFQTLNHVNQIVRVDMKKKELRDKSWATLEKMIKQDAIFAEIVEGAAESGAEAKVKAIDWGATDEGPGRAREKELLKVEQRVGPLKSWVFNVMQKRFQQLTLTMNGVVLRGVTPRNAYNEANKNHRERPSFRDDTYHWVTFELERKMINREAEEAKGEDAAVAAAWSRLLGRPKLREPVRLTLTLPEPGLELRTKVTPDAKDEGCHFYLIGIREEVLYATVAVFVCLLGFLGWLARTTDILRDSSGPIRPDGIEPVSLAKTQMAFWFILTASAFAFLWVTTGNIDTINKTCLVLLGIGTGTALGAALIPSTGSDGKKQRNYLVEMSLLHTREEAAAEIRASIVERVRLLWLQTADTEVDRRKALLALMGKVATKKQWTDLSTELVIDPGAVTAETGANEAVVRGIALLVRELRKEAVSAAMEPVVCELELLGKQLKDFEAMERTGWKRLFADLLNENASGGSYEFHRFQMLGWTLLLGLIFLVKLLNDRAMPEFGDTTLMLLGISGGTYLGFKLPAVKGAEARREDATG